MVETGHDMAGPRARMAWPLGGVSQCNWAYRDRKEAWPLRYVTIQSYVS